MDENPTVILIFLFAWIKGTGFLCIHAEERKNSLLDPVSLRPGVEGCPLHGLKETGAGLCVCVCMILILATVFLSHTVGPTSCFHCPSLLPRERREEGERDAPQIPPAAPVVIHSAVLPVCSKLLTAQLSYQKYDFSTYQG